jgi:itaconyl-CoA hydratase
VATREGWRGRFYENFEVGDIYEHSIGRTVTTTDNMWFTLLTQNTAPIHVDHAYAAQTQFANLGWDEVRLPAPVFEGDTIYSRSEVLQKRESRPDVGIVVVRTTGYYQDGTTVIEFKRTVMVYKKGYAPRNARAFSEEREQGQSHRTTDPPA